MMQTTVLTVLTVALGAGGAMLAARYSRDVNDTVRTLARRGTHICLISRRTRLPQDVVTMMIARMATRDTAPRQKVPLAAVYAPPAGQASRRSGQQSARNSLLHSGISAQSHGMDVA